MLPGLAFAPGWGGPDSGAGLLGRGAGYAGQDPAERLPPQVDLQNPQDWPREGGAPHFRRALPWSAATGATWVKTMGTVGTWKELWSSPPRLRRNSTANPALRRDSRKPALPSDWVCCREAGAWNGNPR